MAADHPLCSEHDGIVRNLKQTREEIAEVITELGATRAQVAGLRGQLGETSALLTRLVDGREHEAAARLTLSKERLSAAHDVAMRLLQRDALLALVVIAGLLTGGFTLSAADLPWHEILPVAAGSQTPDDPPAMEAIP